MKPFAQRISEIREDPVKLKRVFIAIWVAAYAMLILGAFIIIWVLIQSL